MIINPYVFAAPVGPVDPYFAYVEMLLHGDGADGSTVFADSSGKKTVTGSGGAAISTAQSKFGGSSIYLDASGDYLTVAPDITLSSGDFTFEYLVFFTADLTQNPVLSKIDPTGSVSGYWMSSGYSSGNLRVVWQQWADGGTYNMLEAIAAKTLDTWVAVCFERIGSELKIYIDGVLSATSSGWAFYPGAGAGYPTYIGQYAGSPGSTLNGYIEELRLTKRPGGRYGGAYTPATAPFPDA